MSTVQLVQLYNFNDVKIGDVLVGDYWKSTNDTAIVIDILKNTNRIRIQLPNGDKELLYYSSDSQSFRHKNLHWIAKGFTHKQEKISTVEVVQEEKIPTVELVQEEKIPTVEQEKMSTVQLYNFNDVKINDILVGEYWKSTNDTAKVIAILKNTNRIRVELPNGDKELLYYSSDSQSFRHKNLHWIVKGFTHKQV